MPSTRYTYNGPGALLSENRNGTLAYYRIVATGSTTQIFSQNGTVTASMSFGWFGPSGWVPRRVGPYKEVPPWQNFTYGVPFGDISAVAQRWTAFGAS